MIDFEKRKEKNILNSQLRQEETLLNTEQSKFLYEITFNNSNQIKDIQKEIQILKMQMCDILNIFNDKSLLNESRYKNNNSRSSFKKEKNFEEKNELKDFIINQINTQLKENFEMLNNKIILFNDEYKSELNNEIEKINNELLNHDKLLKTLKNNKLDKIDFDKNISDIKRNFEDLNEKRIQNKYEMKINDNDIFRKSLNSNSFLEIQNIKKLKKEIYSDFEKINLKILNELKNQAYDIKSIYQELQSNSKINLKNSMNLEEDTENTNYSQIINTINNLEKELSKKVNLEQLNFAFQTQSKLNEALNSTCQICRMCWNSEGILSKKKYIKWSSQNINTALNIFNWERDSDTIKILQKGVYKIVVGLIGLESDKKINICFNEINKYENDNNNYNIECSSGNVKYIEKYFACIENTDIKIWLIDEENNNNDTSEEAFLELEKII